MAHLKNQDNTSGTTHDWSSVSQTDNQESDHAETSSSKSQENIIINDDSTTDDVMKENNTT